MRPPPSALELVHKAIAAGIFGQIEWHPKAYDLARERQRADLLKGLTPQEVRLLLHDYVLAGNRLDERKEEGHHRKNLLDENVERDPYYRDFWYRAVIPVPELFPKGLFVEVRLSDNDEQNPYVQIVNAHPQT